MLSPVDLRAEVIDSLDVSLLTCGVGTTEVYQSYGHTGVRVQNHSRGTDIVYNYGMFNFYEEGFLGKFLRGKLLYYVGTEHFADFMQEYLYYGRSVREQTLNLTSEQKHKLVLDLETNALPENKYYLYDFTHNNCSTQPRDLIRNSMGKGFEYATLGNSESETFREMIARYMSYNLWLSFGIDLILGMRFDQNADTEMRMFLPEELMEVFDSTQHHGLPLVKENKVIFSGYEQPESKFPSPVIVFSILLAIIAGVQVFVQNEKVHRVIARTILSIIGLVGIFILLFWVGTDHYMTKWNLNLLWAIPLYFPWVLIPSLQGNIWKKFMSGARVLTILVLLTGCWLPQELNIAVLPILLMAIWAQGILLSK